MRDLRAKIPALIGGILILISLTAPALARSADAGDYAYLFVQGRISDPSGAGPVEGATVRLSASSEVFETRTDRRGIFVFDRIPVASYEVEILTPDGKRIHGARAISRFDPERARVRIDTDPRNRSSIRLETSGDEVAVVVRKPPPNWRKLWSEVLVFVGAAGLFAL